MSSKEITSLGAVEAAAAVASGELDRNELFSAWQARAQLDDLNAQTWVSTEPTEAGAGPINGVPLAIKDLFCTKGVPSQSGSRIIEG